VSTCPVCGLGETDYPTRFDYTPVSHLACVEKQAKALEASASLEGDYSEAQEFIRSLQREAAFWEWLATHEYRCPLGEMNPGEEGSYLVEVTYTVEFLAHMRERWEREGE
jgi:hypothetical protein